MPIFYAAKGLCWSTSYHWRRSLWTSTMSWRALRLAMLLLTMKILSKSCCECNNKAWSGYTFFSPGIYGWEKYHVFFFIKKFHFVCFCQYYYFYLQSFIFWRCQYTFLNGVSFSLVITYKESSCLVYTRFWKHSFDQIWDCLTYYVMHPSSILWKLLFKWLQKSVPNYNRWYEEKNIPEIYVVYH